MKAEDFYQVVREYEPQLESVGFYRKSHNTYVHKMTNKYSLKFVLDRYGWDPMNGHGFVMRITDLRFLDNGQLINMKGELDVSVNWLRNTKIFNTASELAYLSVDPRSKMYSSFWITFYSPTQLRSFFDTFLKNILVEVLVWCKRQEAVDISSIQRPERAQIAKEAKEALAKLKDIAKKNNFKLE